MAYAKHQPMAGKGSRCVRAELLDSLPAEHPGAQRSRRDLRRLNAWMGSARILANACRRVMGDVAPRRVAELGGGDGTLLLDLARRLPPSWRGVSVEVVDRQNLLAPETVHSLKSAGWEARAVQCDVFCWLAESEPVDLILANLFLHHFDEDRLRELLERIAARAERFVACEPRRFSFPRIAGSLVTLIGCNWVTRHDAIASIRAGFRNHEVGSRWPRQAGWQKHEEEAGLFSHAFVAWRS